MKKILIISYLLVFMSTITPAYADISKLALAVEAAEGMALVAGIAGGAALVRVATGTSTAQLMNDYKFANCDDQEACDKAKIGSYAVGVFATIVTTGAELAGLVTLGGTLAGVATLIAVSIVMTVAGGYGTYWVYHTLLDNETPPAGDGETPAM